MNGWRLEYSIDVDEEHRIVYEKIFGIWREKTALSYKADFEEQVAPITKKPWAKLIDLKNWKTGSSEVIEIVGDHLEWCREHNMEWSINIIDNPVTYGQLMRMFDRGSTRKISKTFRSRVEAEKFLREQGYQVRSASDTRP